MDVMVDVTNIQTGETFMEEFVSNKMKSLTGHSGLNGGYNQTKLWFSKSTKSVMDHLYMLSK